uniref:ribosomal protein L6 n=1 Tax=Cryptomonas gyropyrenoidosa TaxID=233257 RepID=UPI002798147A|nr:ribosomal protein L6 [Cryptomonas gyropyrenoidosa]WFQ82699.1 ribosomal protein L6 [Cryptomonas gyropyrenoidosa]
MLILPTSTKFYKFFFYKNNVFFTNKFGITKIDTSAFAFELQVTTSNKEFGFNTHKTNKYSANSQNYFQIKITKTIDSLNKIFKKKLVFFGVGFRYWLCNRNNLEFIVVKLGYSRDILIKIPLDIYIVPIKSTLLVLKSFNKLKLHSFAALLLSLKKFDVYKGKGLKYFDEKISLKLGKLK